MRGSAWLKNAGALGIGVVLAAVMVTGIDWLFAWQMDVEIRRAPPFFPDPTVPHGLGWGPSWDSKRRQRERGGKLIFDVTYHFDELRRRVTPFPPDQPVDEFVVFFGGSQTFGAGLEDDETIPALVQRALPDRRVYNYAYGGWGSSQMLRLLEAGHLPREIPESRGTAFYQYIEDHVSRAIGRMRTVAWAGGRHPYYRLDRGGELEYAGYFATGRPVTTGLYWLLSRSAVLKYFEVDLPPSLRPDHYALACRIVQRAQDLFLAQFPGSRFAVVVALPVPADDPFVPLCLDAEGIAYADLRPEYREGVIFDGDPHFSPVGARITADAILRFLSDPPP